MEQEKFVIPARTLGDCTIPYDAMRLFINAQGRRWQFASRKVMIQARAARVAGVDLSIIDHKRIGFFNTYDVLWCDFNRS